MEKDGTNILTGCHYKEGEPIAIGEAGVAIIQTKKGEKES